MNSGQHRPQFIVLSVALASLLLVACVARFRSGSCDSQSCAARIEEVPAWAVLFQESGVEGTFVLYDPATGVLRVHNLPRAERGFLPASTFKVFNSLVALEEGAVESTAVRLKWDGTEHTIKSWNRDHDMRSAIQDSAVWYYQELARRVGERQMQHWLGRLEYGNGAMGASIDTFWLQGELRISALQQVRFLDDLRALRLPFERRVQRAVKDIMLLVDEPNFRLYAKTGWAARVDPMTGWFVGFVQSQRGERVFALNIDMETGRKAPLRRRLTERIFRLEGLR